MVITYIEAQMLVRAHARARTRGATPQDPDSPARAMIPASEAAEAAGSRLESLRAMAEELVVFSEHTRAYTLSGKALYAIETTAFDEPRSEPALDFLNRSTHWAQSARLLRDTAPWLAGLSALIALTTLPLGLAIALRGRRLEQQFHGLPEPGGEPRPARSGERPKPSARRPASSGASSIS